MDDQQNYACERERLRGARLRPTRQRLALTHVLYAAGNRHVTPEQVFEEAKAAGVQVSLATIYNTLNQFTAAGMLRQVTLAQGKTFFDTNIGQHQHFYDENTHELIDVPEASLRLEKLPEAPPGKSIASIDVVVRIR